MRPSLRELLALFEKNPELPEEAKHLNKLIYYTKVRHGPTTAAYHTLRAINTEEAEIFFKNLEEGAGLAKNDPIFRLREWCNSDARTRNTTGLAPPTHATWPCSSRPGTPGVKGKTVQKLSWLHLLDSAERSTWPELPEVKTKLLSVPGRRVVTPLPENAFLQSGCAPKTWCISVTR